MLAEIATEIGPLWPRDLPRLVLGPAVIFLGAEARGFPLLSLGRPLARASAFIVGVLSASLGPTNMFGYSTTRTTAFVMLAGLFAAEPLSTMCRFFVFMEKPLSGEIDL